MSPYLLLTVLAIAASAASETTPKSTIDITTKRPGIQPLPAKLPGSATPPSYVRDTRQVSVTTTPKSRPLTDSPKFVTSSTPLDITATPTFPRRRRESEDENEKTFPTGNQRPLFGGAFGQLFASRPNFALPNLFGNRRPALADQDVSDLTIQSQTVPAAGLQTFGATQTVSLSNQPEQLTAAQTTSQLASQSATLTGSQSTGQPSSPSTTVTTNLLSEATSTTTHSNVGQTTQSSTESRKTRDVVTESPFPKSNANEDGFKPTSTWTTAPTEFKPYTLIANLRTTQKPLGISSQTSISGNGGSASAFASASSPLGEGITQSTTAQNKDSVGDGWNKPIPIGSPSKRDPFQEREKRSADQSTQKPQTGSVLGGSTRPLPTTTIKPQYTRVSQAPTKSTQKPGGLPTTTPRSRTAYPTTSPVRPTRSAATDSPQKTTKNIPTTVAPGKRDVLKTTPKPTTAPKRTARDTKSSATTTQKPQTSSKKVSN